jgi:hypothetical protein
MPTGGSNTISVMKGKRPVTGAVPEKAQRSLTMSSSRRRSGPKVWRHSLRGPYPIALVGVGALIALCHFNVEVLGRDIGV